MRPATFHASIASLTLRMVTVASTIALLQLMTILPEKKSCPICYAELGPFKTERDLAELSSSKSVLWPVGREETNEQAAIPR